MFSIKVRGAHAFKENIKNLFHFTHFQGVASVFLSPLSTKFLLISCLVFLQLPLYSNKAFPNTPSFIIYILVFISATVWVGRRSVTINSVQVHFTLAGLYRVRWWYDRLRVCFSGGSTSFNRVFIQLHKLTLCFWHNY